MYMEQEESIWNSREVLIYVNGENSVQFWSRALAVLKIAQTYTLQCVIN